VTHRVISVGASLDGSGDRVLRTQGDANDAPDQNRVREIQVRGRLWYAIPYLGHVTTRISGSTRQVVTTVAVGGLLAYAAWMFGSTIHERRRGRERRGGAHAA
jgi:signal peptidase